MSTKQRHWPRGACAIAFALPACSPTARIAPTAPPSQPEAASGFRAGLTAATATRHMAAAANPLAAEAGRTILRAGGSAVDAAIAMQMGLNLVEPQNSGIGGGAFVLHLGRPTLESF